jgi:heme A synthase
MCSEMKIWKQLYLIVWLTFLQIIIILLPGLGRSLVDVHAVLGFIILGLAHYDYAALRRTDAPNRLKRIAKSTAALATVQIILGIILYATLSLNVSKLLVQVVTFLHLVIALAIITQAASVATAYDMWEEHEYTTSTP